MTVARSPNASWWLPVLVLALTAAVYWRVPSFELLSWDDDVHITANPQMRPLSWAGVARFWYAPYENLYIPVSYMWFAGAAWLARQFPTGDPYQPFHPAVFHTGSLLLHLAAVGLVYRLLVRWVGHRPSAAVGSLLFGVHPLMVESVAWVSETRGLLAAVFSLAALLAYLPVESNAPRGWGRYWLASGWFVLALLSKPSTVSLPLVAVVLDMAIQKNAWRRATMAIVPWCVLAAALVVMTKTQQADARLAAVPDWSVRPLIAGDALAFYLVKLVAPVRLTFDYGRAPVTVQASGWFYTAWLLPALLTLAAALAPARRVWLSAWAIFVASLLPTLGFIPFLYQSISTVADRYVYLAMLGPAWALAAWLAPRWSTTRLALWAAVLGVFAHSSYSQTVVWRDNTSLYRHALTVNPGSYVAHYGLGNDALGDDRLGEATFHFEQALQLRPAYRQAWSRLAFCRAAENKLADAEAMYRRALELDVKFVEAHAGLAVVLARQERFDEAAAQYRRALEINPRYVEAGARLADELIRHGRYVQAEPLLRQAIGKRPDFFEAQFRLAELLTQRNRPGEAVEHYRAALAAHPRFVAAHNNLAGLLMQSGQLDAAEYHYRQALAVDPRHADARVNLGLVFSAQGQVDKARRQWRQAVDLAPPDSPAVRLARELLQQTDEPSTPVP